MFVFNFNLSKRKIMLFSVFSITLAIVCILSMLSIQENLPHTATCDELGEYSLLAKNREEQCDFLKKLNIEAVENTAQIQEVIIPSEFNATYEQYNKLQSRLGLDLNKYKGKKAQKITYRLKNSDVDFAVILIYKDRIIGGHLTNGEYGQEYLPLI